MQRRLAAILAADVEGYSRLIGEDEEGTVRALKENRAAFFRIVAEGGGTVINTAGDSILAEFGSVMAAVRAATAMQEALRHANAGQAAARQLRFRIGISQGEIVAEGGEIYGDGINVAARLQALAPAGGIARSCASAGRPNTARSWPTSSGATRATWAGRTRRSGPPPTRTCSTRPE